MLGFLRRLHARFTSGRPRVVVLTRFDESSNTWVEAAADKVVDRADLTVTTFNVWFDPRDADQRCVAIADLLAPRVPDVMVFQEVTPPALAVLLEQPWIRRRYYCAASVGDDVVPYGMVMLSTVPLINVAYQRLPTRRSRGFLRAEIMTAGVRPTVCCIHLDSGTSSAPLRARQLRRVFRAMEQTDDAILLGDFNMREVENGRIVAPFSDVWPALRPDDHGFTENTAVNLMLRDAKKKGRQVRFDRILLRGTRWAATHIELLGTSPISDAQPRTFPSDHFGIACRLVRTQ